MDPKSSVPSDKLSNHPSELLLKVGIPESWTASGTGGDPSPDAVSCRCQDPGVADVTSSVTSHSLTSYTASLPGDRVGPGRGGLSLQHLSDDPVESLLLSPSPPTFQLLWPSVEWIQAADERRDFSPVTDPSPSPPVTSCRRQSPTAAVGRQERETSTTVHQRSPHSCGSLTHAATSRKNRRDADEAF